MPPASQANFHLCEQGAETLLSSPILQIQPTYKVINADMEMTFFSPLAVRDNRVVVRGCQQSLPRHGQQTKAVLVS